MKPMIDHIQITVKDMKVAEPFYDKLMPILGFNLEDKVSAVIEEHDLYVVEYLNESFDFGICSPRTAFRGDTIHRRDVYKRQENNNTKEQKPDKTV